jgi:serine/threonine-protein kinase RsbW
MPPQLSRTAQINAKPDCIAEDGITILVDTAFRATDLHVRWAVSHALDRLCEHHIAPDLQFTVEIVLAELLNNIVEHGYRATGEGSIHLKLLLEDGHIRVETIDHGVQMPGHRAPHPPEPNLNVTRDDLPEGHFGWFLIRKLSNDLVYKRTKDENRLSLCIAQ